MRSSAGLTEIVIDGEDKKAKFVSPAKHNIRKGSMDRIRQSPLGNKNTNFYFLISYQINSFGNQVHELSAIFLFYFFISY